MRIKNYIYIYIYSPLKQKEINKKFSNMEINKI